MNIKGKDLIELWNLISRVKKQSNYNSEFTVFLATNQKRIQPIVEELETVMLVKESFKKYDQERSAIAMEHADKDGNGNAMTKDAVYVITKKLKDFNNKIKELKERSKDTIAERNSQVVKYNSLLEKLYKFSRYKIKIHNIPDQFDVESVRILLDADLVNKN